MIDGERRPAEPDRDRHERGQRRPARGRRQNIIRRRSQRSAYAPAGRPDEQVRQRRQHAHDPHREPGPRQRQHEERHRRVGDGVAERADPLAEQHDQEVAVVAQPSGRVGGRRGRARWTGPPRAGRTGDHVGRSERSEWSSRPRVPSPRARRAPHDTPRGYPAACYSGGQDNPADRTTIPTMTDRPSRDGDAAAPAQRHREPVRRREDQLRRRRRRDPLATASRSRPRSAARSRIIGDAPTRRPSPLPAVRTTAPRGHGRTAVQGPDHRLRPGRPDRRHLRRARQPRAHRARRARRPAAS